MRRRKKGPMINPLGATTGLPGDMSAPDTHITIDDPDTTNEKADPDGSRGINPKFKRRRRDYSKGYYNEDEM